MKFVPVPFTTWEERQALDEQGFDFCDGCGMLFSVENLQEAQLQREDVFFSTGLVCASCWQVLLQEKIWLRSRF